jgi:hypothetical protein
MPRTIKINLTKPKDEPHEAEIERRRIANLEAYRRRQDATPRPPALEQPWKNQGTEDRL